jgi:hypothetical protein
VKDFFELRETKVTAKLGLTEATVPRKEFDKLKKGDEVTITYDSSIRKGTTSTFVVKGKSRSAKHDVDKVQMQLKGKPGGMKFWLYSRSGKDATLALGDMAATMTKFVKESVEEAVKTEDKGQFIYAAKQAKAKGDSTFVFAGKTYNCEEVLEDKQECPKCKGEGCDHCDDKGVHENSNLDEDYRKLAVKGMGTETKTSTKVGRGIDYYDGSGTKRSGKVTKMGPKTYMVKDDDDGKIRQFLYHDRAKAKELLAKLGKSRVKESVELDESVDFMKMSKELLKHKSKGIEYEKAAAYIRVIHNNSNVNVQDKAFMSLTKMLKDMDDLVKKTTITKILKDNGFKVKGGQLMRQ